MPFRQIACQLCAFLMQIQIICIENSVFLQNLDWKDIILNLSFQSLKFMRNTRTVNYIPIFNYKMYLEPMASICTLHLKQVYKRFYGRGSKQFKPMGTKLEKSGRRIEASTMGGGHQTGFAQVPSAVNTGNINQNRPNLYLNIYRTLYRVQWRKITLIYLLASYNYL